MEQPKGSEQTIPHHNRFQEWCNSVTFAACLQVHLVSNSREVFKQSFWMMLHGGATPKRTVCWSNSTDILQRLAWVSADLFIAASC